MTVRTYDAKCLELAEHFLADEPELEAQERGRAAVELALEIQTTVEDWFAARARRETPN